MGPEAVERINELLEEVREKLDWVVEKINGVLKHVPFFLQWAVDKFMDLWDKVLEKVGQFWDKVVEFVSYLGQPWHLNDAKAAWIALGSPVAARASEADRSQSTVDAEWKGRAADRYASSLAAQGKALSGVQGKLANPIGPALGSLASALYIFFGVVIAVIIALVIAHNVAAGEAVSIIGLPAVPATLLVAYGAAIGALIAAIANLNNAANSSNTVFQTVAAETADFGAQNWPQAVI